MARITNDALMGQTAFARDSSQPMLNLAHGGQFGYAPNLSEWVSNQAYIRRNLIPILLEAPKFFSLMKDPQKWVDTLKSLIELHCRTIEGYQAGLTVDVDSHPVGGAGELQDEVIDVKRARSEPVFTFVEKYGMPIQTFLSEWIRYGLMDPDTKYAMAGTLGDSAPSDMLADWYSMSILVLEPDPTHRKVVKSWVSTNMFPKGTGEIIGKRDLTAQGEISNLTVEFTAISQFNLGTNIFAQKILDAINLANANPYTKPSFITDIAADVKASTDIGYAKSVTETAKTSS